MNINAEFQYKPVTFLNYVMQGFAQNIIRTGMGVQRDLIKDSRESKIRVRVHEFCPIYINRIQMRAGWRFIDTVILCLSALICWRID